MLKTKLRQTNSIVEYTFPNSTSEYMCRIAQLVKKIR